MSRNVALLAAVLCVAYLADIAVVGESLLFQVYEFGNADLSRWYNMIKTVNESLKESTADEVLWKLGNESYNDSVHSKLPSNSVSMRYSYDEAMAAKSKCVSITKLIQQFHAINNV